MTPVLEVANLTVSCCGPAARRLVRNVSFRIGQGYALALIGESGAGKSLASLAVMDLLPGGLSRTGGSILIGGMDVDELSREEMRALRGNKLAMIMQNPMSAFDPTFTILSHFAETLKSHQRDLKRQQIVARTRASLATAGFDHPDAVMALYPFQMSGGMLQRVMIALALVNGPDLLIADEATTDLDAVSQRQIVDLLKKHRMESGLSLMLVTHDLGVAASLADDIVVMHQGAIVEEGPARQVFTRPGAQYTRRLMAAHRKLYTNRFESLIETGNGDGHALAQTD